jgi:MoaA/NifB/PqqE/SkfB family radical SAM enzyme
MGPTGASRIIQIHPTRRCNLRCLHCYSSSSPQERDRLEVALLLDAITDAAAEGYTVASFSGGEPLLYQPLPTLLEQARQCGMRTTLVSNGMLLDEWRLAELEGLVDLIAISLDGKPESHNHVRGNRQAFEKMRSRLASVRASGIPFGFVFTLTLSNLDELEWVARFAIDEGARLLQIHPLEEVGHAETHFAGKRPDAIENAYAWLLGKRLEKLTGDALAVQIDLIFSEAMKADPALVYAMQDGPDPQRPLAELISPLIVQADGNVVPLEHGFPLVYALGNLRDQRLRTLGARWRATKLDDFYALCRTVQAAATAEAKPRFYNWYELMAQYAQGNANGSVLAAARVA